jgi:general secretion pathway protein J
VRQGVTGRRDRGFTLLEVLVAVGLLGIVSALMYEGIALTFRAREEIARVEELNHSARVALRKLVTDISMAYLSNHVNRDEPASTTLFMGQGDNVLFSYLGHERRKRGARESDQGIVEYRVGRDDEGRTIERREKAVPDNEPDRGGTKETLVNHVKEFRLQYWDDKGEDWKDDWKAEMEQAVKDGKAGETGKYSQVLTPVGSALYKASQDKALEEFRLPDRVYIRLVLEDVDGNEYAFETQARIHMRSPLNF